MEHPLAEKNKIFEGIPFDKLLFPGQEFKNYRVFCQYLGIEVKQGKNPKEHQFKELRCYFDFHKDPDSQKLVIDEVFDAPKQKPMRASNSPMKDADKVLYLHAKNGEFHTPHTYTNIAVSIGLVSTEFWRCHRYPEHLAEHLGVPLKCMEMVLGDIRNSLISFMDGLLFRMRKEGKISVETDMFSKVCEQRDDGTNFDGVRKSNAFELDLNSKCTEEALKLVGCSSVQETHHKGSTRWYYRERERLFRYYSIKATEIITNYHLEYMYCASEIHVTGDMDLSNFDEEKTCDKLRDIFFDACFGHKHPNSMSEIDRTYLLSYFILRNRLRSKRDFELAAWELFSDKCTEPSLARRIKSYCANLLLDEVP